MSAVVWIGTVLLAAIFLFSGAAKLSQKPELLEASGNTFVSGLSDRAIRLIGIIEVVGALGLILPGLTKIATGLVPVAALGLALVMVLAMVLHVRRNEYGRLGTNLVLLALAMFVAFGRLGPAPFGA